MNVLAFSTLIGTIIGAGMFALPYVSYRSGFGAVFIYLIVFGILMTIAHLLYMEVVLSTKNEHRLIGYAEQYIGKMAKKVATLSITLGLYATLLVYIILAVQFIKIIFPGINSDLLALLFVLFNAVFIYKGIKVIAGGEMIFTIGMAVITLIIFYFSFLYINSMPPFNFNLSYLYLPFGVVLFSYDGTSVIPELKSLFLRKKVTSKTFFWSIVAAMIGSFLTYALFTFSVMRVTPVPSPDTVSAFAGKIGAGILLCLSIFGVLNFITSFLAIGVNLKNTFVYDLSLKDKAAFFVVMLLPFILYIFGLRNLIEIISLTGALMSGVNCFLIVWMHKNLKKKRDRAPEFKLNMPEFMHAFLMIVFILGIAYTLIIR